MKERKKTRVQRRVRILNYVTGMAYFGVCIILAFTAALLFEYWRAESGILASHPISVGGDKPLVAESISFGMSIIGAFLAGIIIAGSILVFFLLPYIIGSMAHSVVRRLYGLTKVPMTWQSLLWMNTAFILGSFVILSAAVVFTHMQYGYVLLWAGGGVAIISAVILLVHSCIASRLSATTTKQLW
jgi:predicted anti-sigma-YlaC factor YlaD